MSPSKPKLITQPDEWWDAFERAAKAKGMKLSEWIGDACKKALPKDDRDALPDRVGPGRPEKEDE